MIGLPMHPRQGGVSGRQNRGVKLKMPKAAKTVLYIIFWIFIIVAFSIAAIILVFLASGYKYDSLSGKLEKTGMIYLKSEPANIEVYLDNELKARKTPIRIPHLLPGSYHLKLTVEGYLDWEKEVRVKGGEVASLDRIILFLKERKTKNLTKDAQSFKLAPNKNLVAYINKNKNKLFLLNINDNRPREIYSSKGTIRIFYWSTNSQKILINDSQDGAIVVDTRKTREEIKIRQIAGKNFSSLTWNPVNANYLYGLSSKRLYQIDLIKNQALPLKSNITNFSPSQYDIFYVHNDGKTETFKIRKMDFNGGNAENVITANYPVKKLFVSPNGKIAFVDDKNNLYLHQKINGEYDLQKINERVTGALWVKPDGIIENIIGTEKLAYFTTNEIGGFFRKRDPRLKEEKNYLITRINSKILKIDWYPDYEHIIYLTEGKVNIVELDGSNDITLAKNVKNFEWIRNGKGLLFLDNSGLKIMTIRK